MKRCPICKTKLNGKFSVCPVCKTKLTPTGIVDAKTGKINIPFSKEEAEVLNNYYFRKAQKGRKALLIAAACLGGVAVVAGTTYGITRAVINSSVNDKTFKIKFIGADGEEILQSNKLKYGEEIIYTGATPKKDVGDNKNYIFKGWDPELKTGDKAYEDVTYRAQFTQVDMDKYISATPDKSNPGCCSVSWNQGLSYQPKYLVIPERIVIDGVGYTVTSIKSPTSLLNNNNNEYGAFENCTSLLSVEIPDTVSTIAPNAFKGCTNLKKVKLPEGLETISENAFEDCESLSEITLPDSLVTIKQNAFANCYSLSDIAIPKSVETIEPYAFSVGTRAASGLKNATFKGDTTGNDEYWAIGGEEGAAETNYIPNSTTNNAKYLKNDYCVYSWKKQHNPFFTSMLKFTLNEDGKSYSCGSNGASFASLPDVVIPASHYNEKKKTSYPVTIIDKNAFINSDITSIALPESVKEIKESAFKNCKKLVSINLENVTKLGKAAFYNCTKLRQINEDSSKGKLNDEMVYIPETAFYKTNIRTIELPEGCKSVGKSAFDSCVYLNNIAINNGLEEIATYAFAGTGITKVNIPGKVAKIGNAAFINCTNLSELTINEGTQVISRYAFMNCSSLGSVNLPSSIDTIYAGAFTGSTLSKVKFNVPEGSTIDFDTVDAMLLTTTSRSTKTSAEIEADVSLLSTSSLHFCKSFFNDDGSYYILSKDKSLWLNRQEGIVYLNDSSVEEEKATGISSVTMPSTCIVNEGDEWCRILEITSFGCMNRPSSDFRNYNLLSIRISPNIKQLNRGALYNCCNLQNLNIPRSVKYMEEYAIGYDPEAFYGSLSYIYIPSSLTYISIEGNFAYDGEAYPNLKGIVFEDKETKWSAYDSDYDELISRVEFTNDWEENLNTIIDIEKDYYEPYLISDNFASLVDSNYTKDSSGDVYLETDKVYFYQGDVYAYNIDCSELSENYMDTLYICNSSYNDGGALDYSCGIRKIVYTNTLGNSTDLTYLVWNGSFNFNYSDIPYVMFINNFFSVISDALKEESLTGQINIQIGSDVLDFDNFYLTTRHLS